MRGYTLWSGHLLIILQFMHGLLTLPETIIITIADNKSIFHAFIRNLPKGVEKYIYCFALFAIDKCCTLVYLIFTKTQSIVYDNEFYFY